MKGFDKLHVKSAVKSRNRMNLDQVHLTTMDFGQVVPLYHRALVPGDQFTINANYFSRLAPLVKPTYGKFSFRTMAAFVPFHQVAYDADAFISGSTAYEGITPSIRFISYVDFVYLLMDPVITDVETDMTKYYDFKLINGAGTLQHYVFTNFGRYVYKVLTSLGYAIPQNIDMQTTSSWYGTYSTQNLNALPLLCFIKAFNDNMRQGSRYNTATTTAILRAIKHNIDYPSCYTAATHKVTSFAFIQMFKEVQVTYENDYFVSAWRYIESPTGLSQSISNVDAEGFVLDNVSYSPTGPGSGLSVSSIIYQRSLDILKSFYNFVKRNNYTGSRDVQQVFSRFGIKSEDYDANYSHLISTSQCPITVGDVTSQADTTNAALGDYAGKGIMNDQKNISYKSSDFGMLFILGWMTVVPMYPYGFEREVLKVQAPEFYLPEFDGVGADAISFGEVFANPKADASDTSLDSSVFGFTERYNDYRYARDQITGDFRRYDNSDPMNVWHSGRLLNDVRKAGQMVAQSHSMNLLANYDSEYNRIFSVTSGDVDHFYMTCNFKVTAIRPMLSLNQVPGLGEGDTVVNRNGNNVN